MANVWQQCDDGLLTSACGRGNVTAAFNNQPTTSVHAIVSMYCVCVTVIRD